MRAFATKRLGEKVLKITSVDVFLLNTGSPAWRPIVCRVNTDEGISGFGEASVAFDTGAEGAYSMLREVAALVIGMDAFATEAIWDHMFSDSFWGQGGGVCLFSAFSAIDMALWDIKGKALNVPVYKLLGGKCRDTLRAYASQLQFGWGTEGMRFDIGCKEQDMVVSALRAVEEGYDAVKFNFITFDENGDRLGFLRGPVPIKIRRMVERRMAAVRRAVGPDIDIIVENHARTDAVSGAELARIAADYNVLFIEEACTPLSVQTMAELRARSQIPVAGGERIYGRWNFLNFFKAGAIQVAQPDVGSCGGISECKKISDMAHAFDVGIQLHVCGSPIAIAASLHLECSIPNFVIHEHHVTNRCSKNIDLCIYDYQPVNGSCAIPELPGIGQELSKKAMSAALLKSTVPG